MSNINETTWYGKIPSDWNLERLKWNLFEINEKNTNKKTDFILSLTNKDGVIPYSEKGNQGNNSKDNILDYKIAYPDTIVANSMNILIGSVGYCKYLGCVSPVYYVFKNYSNSNLKFLNYIFQCEPFQKQLRRYANGILEIRLRVSANSILSQYVPIPSLSIQNKIVSILDKKISIIDKLIENEKKQIEKLEEYKKAIITKAVTKGLNPNAKMKDSGIEWIGEIPDDWKVIRLKFTSWLKGRIGWDGLKSHEFIDEGPYLITGTDFMDGKINWNTCVHITEDRYNQDELLHIKPGDLLITKDGTIGKLAIIDEMPEKVSLNSGVMIIRNDSLFKYNNKFLYYVLSSNVFSKWYLLSQNGNSTIRHLYQEQFYNFIYPFPNEDAQRKISDYLDKKNENINKIIYIKKNKLAKIDEIKKSIIYEMVTGKKYE